MTHTVQSSSLITSPPASLGSLLSFYNATLSSLLDKYASAITKFFQRSTKSYHGSLLLSMPYDSPFVVLNTSTNALTLLFFSSLKSKATTITNSSFHPKRNITPSLLSLIIFAVSGKLSINYSVGNRHPPCHLFHKSFPPLFYLSTHRTDSTDSSCISFSRACRF